MPPYPWMSPLISSHLFLHFLSINIINNEYCNIFHKNKFMDNGDDKHMLDFDQKIAFQLPFTKVFEVIPISEDQVLLLYQNYKFVVLRLSLPKCELLSQGSLPSLASKFQSYSKTEIIFLHMNEIIVFDWVDKAQSHCISLPSSKIYKQNFDYFLGINEILFWKTSRLLHEYENLTYDIEVYSRRDMNRVKKYRKVFNQLHELIFCYNQVVLFQIRGFRIQIKFLEEQSFQEIQSIYSLLFLEKTIRNDSLMLSFTHNELQSNEMMTFMVSPHQVIKEGYEAVRQRGEYRFGENIKIIVPDLTMNYSHPSIQIQFHVKFTKQYKYLLLLNEIIEEKERHFLAPQILSLLWQ